MNLKSRPLTALVFSLSVLGLWTGCVESNSTLEAVDGGCNWDDLTYYEDEDGDGLGNPESTIKACEPPEGYVRNNDDRAPNCAENITDECGRCGGDGPSPYYADQDSDGQGDPSIRVEACDQPDGFVVNGNDPDPLCETDDTDECGRCGGTGPTRSYADQDGDGLGDEAVSVQLCDVPDGFVRQGGDPEPNCATNDTDNCGVCAGENRAKDCAGVCFGTAELDGCKRCSGGMTGRSPAIADADGDEIPDLCDQCPANAMARTIIQWTGIAHAGGAGGPYTFQTILFENGDFVFQYRDVEPYEATLTLGYQTAPDGPAAALDVNGSMIRETRSIYFARDDEGRPSLRPTIAYNWIDIRHRGDRLDLGDDDAGLAPLGFEFAFGDRIFREAVVGSNGWIAFAGNWPSAANTPLPNAEYGSFLAPFWDDLDPTRSRGTIRFLHLPAGCEQDCAGDFGGTATVDGCEQCVGGRTLLEPEASRDCSGICDGGARIDVCGECAGGETGLEPMQADDCPQGPDLIVDRDYLANTVTIEETEINDPCLIEERCVRGLGMRTLLRFGTRIANLGNQDLQLGRPADDLPHWHWDECHSHYHFLAYAAYELHDVRTGEVLPFGAKSGFSVIDIGVYDPELAPDGCVGYNGQNQGISVGCQDTYGRGLQCQWIDITGLEDGLYDLVVITNPEQEIEELNYDNNAASVRIDVVAGQVRVMGQEHICDDQVDNDGDGLTDCDDPDCVEICALPPRLPPLACPVDDLESNIGTAVVEGQEMPVRDNQNGLCAGQGRGEMGYRWSAPSDDTYLFHTLGSTYDTSLYVRRGGCDGEVLACSEESGPLPGADGPAVVLPLTAGEVVTIVVDGMLHDDGVHQVNIYGRAGACAGEALEQAVGAAVIAGDTADAPTVFLSPCGGAGHQKVHTWQAPEAGVYEITTAGSDYDTVLFVLDGDCGPDAIACNDDSDGLQSSVRVEVEAGQVLTLVVGGFANNSGQYVLNIEREALAEGPCPDVEAVAMSGIIHEGGADDRFARREASCGSAGREVLIGWAAPAADEYLFHTMGSDGDPILYAFNGCDGDELACNHDYLGLGTVSGFVLDLAEGDALILGVDGLPPNDEIKLNAFGRQRDCEAVDLMGPLGPAMAMGRSEDATTRFAANCGGMTGQLTFGFTAPEAGRYAFDTAGSDYDTVLEILANTCGDSLGCNDDFEGLQSRLEIDLLAGQQITIVVGGYHRSRGQFVLNGGRLVVEDEPAGE